MTEGPERSEQLGIGTPDGFARLWTPHRMTYIKRDSSPGAERSCPFCEIPHESDEQGLIVARGERVYAVLNLYPYNPGHLMVVPYRHVPDYADLDDDELSEFTAFTRRALAAVRAASNPQGFNIGINAGVAGGAGIAPHLHQHVVPRWVGDSNFMPVVAQTKVLPQLLADTRSALAEVF